MVAARCLLLKCEGVRKDGVCNGARLTGGIVTESVTVVDLVNFWGLWSQLLLYSLEGM